MSRHSRNILAEKIYLAGLRLEQSGNCSERRRLARAVRTNQSDNLALLRAQMRHIPLREAGYVTFYAIQRRF